MPTYTQILISLIAAAHMYFLVLEMFLWQKPIGRKIFRTTEEVAKSSAVLAANQGLYNGFLAAGLLWSVYADNNTNAIFFLLCVSVAGVFGAYTVNRRIFFVQALPAIVAILLLAN